MRERTRVMDKVVKVDTEKVECAVEDDRGNVIVGKVFLPKGSRIKDLLDGDEQSIALLCPDGKIRLMNKRFIRAVNVPAAESGRVS